MEHDGQQLLVAGRCWPFFLACDALALACPQANAPAAHLHLCSRAPVHLHLLLCAALPCTALYRLQWFGFIKDYDGGTLMECRIHPTLPYASFPGGWAQPGVPDGRLICWVVCIAIVAPSTTANHLLSITLPADVGALASLPACACSARRHAGTAAGRAGGGGEEAHHRARGAPGAAALEGGGRPAARGKHCRWGRVGQGGAGRGQQAGRGRGVSRLAAVGSTARRVGRPLACSNMGEFSFSSARLSSCPCHVPCCACCACCRGAGGGLVPGSGHAVQAVPNRHERADTGPHRGGCPSTEPRALCWRACWARPARKRLPVPASPYPALRTLRQHQA